MSIIVKVKSFLSIYCLLAGASRSEQEGRQRSKLWQANEISYNSDRNICLVAGLTILIYVNVLLGDIANTEQFHFLSGRRHYGRVGQGHFKLQTVIAHYEELKECLIHKSL